MYYDHVLCTMCYVLCTMYHLLCTMYCLLCSMYCVRGGPQESQESEEAQGSQSSQVYNTEYIMHNTSNIVHRT